MPGWSWERIGGPAWVRGKVRILLCAAAGVLASGIPGPDVLLAQIGLQEVTALSFRGNREFPDEVLANAIITRETECRAWLLVPFCVGGADFAVDPYYFSPREFLRDQARVRLFYYQRGYREATVDTLLDRPSDHEVRIVFQIEEGDPVVVEELEFPGTEELPDSTVLEDLPLRVGDPLSGIALDAARDTLLMRLRNRGYAHAEVLRSYFIPRDSPYSAQVSFDLYPGTLARFGPMAVTGNVTVSETVVRRMLPFREGDLFSQDRRFAGQRNLYNLDIFSFADIQPDLGHQPDSIVPLSVMVAEGDVHRVRTGAGLSTADCLNGEARWASRNFLGGARRLQVTGRISNVLAPSLESSLCKDAGTGEFGRLNWLVSTEFTQPWLFSPRNSLSASVFGERQSIPGIFVRQALGGNLALTRSLGVSTPLTFSIRPQISRLDAAEIFFCSNYLVCAPRDIRILQGANWLSPVGVSLFRDRRNQALSPTRGYSALMDLEHAAGWTGSEFRYTRLIAEGTWYTQGRSRWVLAMRLRGGWVNPEGFTGLGGQGLGREIVHPDKRLYAGGSNSVRGFGQNRLGPKVLQVPDVTELLFADPNSAGASPLCSPESILDLSCDASALADQALQPRPTGGTSLLEGSLEVRFPVSGRRWEGAAFLDFGDVWGEGDRVDLGSVELTPGMGIRYFSPIGPIRVDLAYRFAEGERLQVVTSQIRPFEEGVDMERDLLTNPQDPNDTLLYVPSKELALLSSRVLWGELDPWSPRRFQIHLSIGQAF
ncbi:outer membrane protein assembly factor [Gemmatimonadota bacterium]